jgi:hypothetical protein
MKDRRHDLYNLTDLNNEKLFRMRRKNYRREDKSFAATAVEMPIITKLIKTITNFMRNVNNKLRKIIAF